MPQEPLLHSAKQRKGFLTSICEKLKRLTALVDFAFCTPARHEQIERAFCVTSRGGTLTGELRAGTTAFLAAAQNFVADAHIMSHAGIDARDCVVNGAFVCGLANIASGILSNLPVGLMPGVGPNVLLAFSLVANHVCTTEQALAVAFMTGFLSVIITLTPLNKLIIGLVPLCVRYGLLLGTGLLCSLIGMKAVGVVVPDPGEDIVALGTLTTLEVKICACFLFLIVTLLSWAVRGAVLIGMLGATVTFWFFSDAWPSSFVSPALPSFHRIDASVLLKGEAWLNIGALIVMLTLSSCGAIMSTARMGGMLRADGGVNGSTSVYLCCGLATMTSSVVGSSPVYVSMAASAGVHDGGRTGIVSIVVGIYSLVTALLFSPLISSIPKCAIAPVLLLVGVSLMGEAKHVEWSKIDQGLPAFLCAIFQPFTFSVAHGINAGLASSFVLFLSTGQFVYFVPKLQKYLGVKSAEDESPVTNLMSPLGDPPIISPGGRRAVRRDVQRQTSPAGDDSQKPALRSPPLSPGIRKDPKRDVPWSMSPGAEGGRSPMMSRQASPEDEMDPSMEALCIRRPLHTLGVGKRRQAENLIDRLSILLGLDPEAAHRVFEERLEEGRHNNFTLYKEQCLLRVSNAGGVAGEPSNDLVD
eukprot:TRINITY_DN71251_c0_g1_i1.p1 TRINITY_DN71251_c0_g1~~TRINITY_DN71251_c0_g1_i1.p1  ORF type:complete len:641 (+),score=67.32 TRINITY_DN71251_c0_g1_i1:53-1975(+)